MTIYIIERDNPVTKPEPEVMLDGKEAEAKVRKEYEGLLEELDIDLKDAENNTDARYGCYWQIEECTGTVLIDSDYDIDRWEWRITKHEI